MSSRDYQCKMDNHGNFLASKAFEFLNNSDFTDVTLLCDGEQIKTHKAILAASCDTFKSIFSSNSDLGAVFMRGVQKLEMSNILQFIYTGFVELDETDLASFLQLATELQIRELSSPPEILLPPEIDICSISPPSQQNHASPPSPVPEDIPDNQMMTGYRRKQQLLSEMKTSEEGSEQELDSYVNQEQDNLDMGFVCDVCYGIYKTLKTLKRHKLTHTDIIKFPCNLCGKQFVRHDVLKKHQKVKHMNEI